MAKIEVNIDTPKVPNNLRARMPFAKRGTPVPLSHFSVEQLEKVGKAWTEALLARRALMIRTGATDED